ncbi:MAG: hypothetical protein ACYC2K_12500 [Gemmatimonadales bacterium]
MGLTAVLTGRSALLSVNNRAAQRRLAWQAESCVTAMRAAISSALHAAASDAVSLSREWRLLDETVSRAPIVRGCPGLVRLQASGTAIPVNTDNAPALLSVLMAEGFSPATADSMIAALFDWRDTDDVTRPLGAEADWHRSERRRGPRNGPVVSTAELTRVRGFDAWLADSSLTPLVLLFTVDSGRPFLEAAHARTRDALRLLQAGDITTFERNDVPLPDHWRVNVTSTEKPGTSGGAHPSVTIELLLVRSGAEVTMVQQRFLH